jgi:tetratricopeptide (TPR) repeat protein
MSNRVRLALLVVAVAAVAALAVWWALPRLAAALPGRVRQYVPEALIERVTTPLPTALPAPAGPAPAALDLALGTLPAAPTEAPTVVIPTADSAENLTPVVTPIVATPTIPAPAPKVLPSPTSPPLAPYSRIAGLPIIPQKFNNCGPTNLTLVLNYYGVAVDQFDVAGVVRPNYEDRNVSPGELAAYVNDQTDFSAAAYAGGDANLLRQLIAAGFPVIIEKGLIPDEATGWMGHYLTIYGYSDITGHFLVRDTFLGPWQGDGMASYSDTERYWSHFNGAFLVVYPPERAAEVAELLGPAFASPAAMWEAAAELARRTVQLAPGDAFAWFNLGTSLLELAKLGDTALYEASAAAFDQARLLNLPARMLWYQFAPYEAYLAAGRSADVVALAEATLAAQGGRNVEETYLYLGRALRLAGDEDGARAAFGRAAELNPESPVGLAARAALEDG